MNGGVRSKIDRAQQHLDDVERQLKTYWDSEPYRIGLKTDAESGAWAFYIESITEPVPASVATVAGDAIHNLRSAFDYLIYAAVPRSGRRDQTFPIWRAPRRPTQSEWKGLWKAKLHGAGPDMIKAVRSLQPYEGGNESWLWAIDYLDIVDKHRLLFTVASTNRSIIINGADLFRAFIPAANQLDGIPDMDIGLVPNGWDPVEPGIDLFTGTGADALQAHANAKFAFDVTLGEPAVLQGQPLLLTLTGFMQKSEELLQRLATLI